MISLQAQVTDSIVNVREHGEQYLLSEPFQDSCTGFDIFDYYYEGGEQDLFDILACGMNFQFSPEYKLNYPGLVNGLSVVYEPYIADIAQPYYTDTLLTIKGIAIFSPRRYFMCHNAYLCIADSNLTTHRKIQISDTPLPVEHNFQGCTYWLNYEEFWLDTAINVKDKFYVVWDSPKPAPYTGYGWENECQLRVEYFPPNTDWVFYKTFLNAPKNVTLMAARDSADCPATMLPLIKRYKIHDPSWQYGTDKYPLIMDTNATVDFANSDTSWLVVTSEPTLNVQVTNIYSWNHNKVTAYYMFPIFEELDTTAPYMYPIITDTIQDTTITQDTSALSSVAVDKFTHIFPNPTSELVTVQCSFKIKTIEVYNSLGQKVEEFSVDGYNKSINTEKYPKGNYILKVITESGTIDKKVIFQ